MANLRRQADVPKSTPLTACTTQRPDGSFCEAASLPDSPFPICLRHGAQLYDFLRGRIEQARADGTIDDAVAQIIADHRAAAATRIGVVYYVAFDNLIKIGTTFDLAQRLRSYPPMRRLLASEPGGTCLESERLAQFHRSRVAGREWFLPTQDLLAHIAEVRRAGFTDNSGSAKPRMPLPVDLELLDSLVTPTEAADLAGVKVATIRKWVQRDQLEPASRDHAGRPRFRWIDVARAEHATRDRARRTFAA